MKKAGKAFSIRCRRPDGRVRMGIRPFLVLLTMGMALAVGCGKKGPPFLPEKKTDYRVERLTGSWANGAIRLQGTVKGAEGHPNLTGCRISYAWYPDDRIPCEGCPVQMTEMAGNGDFRLSGDRFTCAVPVVEKRGIWVIEIRLIDKAGAAGPVSERIRIHVRD